VSHDLAIGYTSGDDRKAFVTGDEMSGALVWTGEDGDNAIEAKVTDDTHARVGVEVDGTIAWGPGDAAADTNLFRGGEGVLQTDRVLQLGSTGTLRFGASGDTELVRTGAAQLTLDGDLVVTGSVDSSPGAVDATSLTVSEDAAVDGNLSVAGTSTFAGTVSGEDLELDGDLTVGGAATTTSLSTGALAASEVTSSGPITGTDLVGDTLDVAGAAGVGSLVSEGVVEGTDITASGTVTGADVTATDTLSGASAAVSGAITAGSVSSGGAISGTDITGSGTVQGATVTSTGAVNGGSLAVSGNATVGGTLIVDGVISGPARLTVQANTQTGTSYTLVLGDGGGVVEMNNSGANTLTVPPNSSVAFPVGTIVEVYQHGAGQTTIAAGSGVTIRAPRGLKLASQYASAVLRKRATNEWVLTGDVVS